MTRGITVRKKLIWTLLYVSAGELTLAEHAASAGKRTKGGAEVRLLNIEADAGRGLGLFETLHGAASPDAFADDLRDAARRFYGTPLRAFVKRLARDQSGVERALRANKHSFIQQFVPTNAAGEVRRAADRFAIIGAAGELATEWALTGWRPGEAIEAAQRCLQGWIASRGTAGASDLEVAIRQVRAFLEAHGASRFQLLNHSSRASEADSIIRRAGFKRTDENGGTEYLILRETFRTEVCAGHSYQSVAKELEKRDFLVREGKEMMIKPRLPELGTTWVYCIRAAILESDEC